MFDVARSLRRGVSLPTSVRYLSTYTFGASVIMFCSPHPNGICSRCSRPLTVGPMRSPMTVRCEEADPSTIWGGKVTESCCAALLAEAVSCTTMLATCVRGSPSGLTMSGLETASARPILTGVCATTSSVAAPRPVPSTTKLTLAVAPARTSTVFVEAASSTLTRPCEAAGTLSVTVTSVSLARSLNTPTRTTAASPRIIW
mmetsp:Transcript_28298/g.47498  ORF Transcript_28298/g.47498 Transcript_28298/m.47498 type:complete len:201 (-) Transcript_28298:2656-3258(-)